MICGVVSEGFSTSLSFFCKLKYSGTKFVVVETNKIFEDMREKEKLSWELTNLWYIILSETSNYFIVMTKQQENEWERTFTANNIKKYTAKQLQEAIDKARAFCVKQGYLKNTLNKLIYFGTVFA